MGSLFTPNGATIWTQANLVTVEGRVGLADVRGESFVDRLEAQLTGLDPGTIQVGAEVPFVQMIGEADTRGENARQHLPQILRRLPEPLALPEPLYSGGVAGFAAGKARLDAHVRVIARVGGAHSLLYRESPRQRTTTEGSS
jgi:hypothetical protein